MQGVWKGVSGLVTQPIKGEGLKICPCSIAICFFLVSQELAKKEFWVSSLVLERELLDYSCVQLLVFLISQVLPSQWCRSKLIVYAYM